LQELVRYGLFTLDVVVVAYFLIYGGVNLTLLIVSAMHVRWTLNLAQIQKKRVELTDKTFTPLISLLVPAYNEEVTIVESVRSLLRLQYPNYEIVIVNDGSKDQTIRVLKEAYQFTRSDVDYHDHLGAARVRAFYRANVELPPGVQRLVLVDKENGGKADALNAAINASQGTYVASMDADSLMIEQALLESVQPILDDPNHVIACGGQIALSNGCRVENGRVVEVRLPDSWIARFQVVEYMRSFTQARTALGQLNALLILSGVFAIFQRQSLIECGGFLSKHMRSKIGHEYCGIHAETVCEDMEVVVRIQRYLIERGDDSRVVFLPFPTSWTEAPEVYQNLGKQRSRWYRGLWEVLKLHKRMMFNPKYGVIGLFSLPYQLVFEAAAPLLELMGYVVVPLSWLVGIFSIESALSFMGMAMAFNLLLSTGSVLLSVWQFKLRPHGPGTALFQYRGAKAILILALAGLVSNLGYRQYLLYWQLKGFKDFLAGKKSWDKFARQGFAMAAPQAAAAQPKDGKA
jgi:cellulose synthase/poly-beta-1,6-N-acetylglucosamine synthase-like glycosyltransferase